MIQDRGGARGTLRRALRSALAEAHIFRANLLAVTNANRLGLCDDDLVVDPSSSKSASEVDLLDENDDSQFADWLEESLAHLRAGQNHR